MSLIARRVFFWSYVLLMIILPVHAVITAYHSDYYTTIIPCYDRYGSIIMGLECKSTKPEFSDIILMDLLLFMIMYFVFYFSKLWEIYYDY